MDSYKRAMIQDKAERLFSEWFKCFLEDLPIVINNYAVCEDESSPVMKDVLAWCSEQIGFNVTNAIILPALEQAAIVRKGFDLD